jgi:hypothetical protein
MMADGVGRIVNISSIIASRSGSPIEMLAGRAAATHIEDARANLSMRRISATFDCRIPWSDLAMNSRICPQLSHP